MEWGSFGPVHLISLAVAAGLLIGLYYLLRCLPQKWQVGILGVLSFSGIAAIVYNLLAWNSPLEYLPLHLCSLNAMVLPFAVFTRKKVLCNLLLVWSLGAVMALVINTNVAGAQVMDTVFCFYYFPHVLEFGIPWLLIKLGLAEKTPRCILPTLGSTFGSYSVIHLINTAINAAQFKNAAGETLVVNYMYSVMPQDPMTGFFFNLIPHAYFYMLLVIPIVAVYLLAIYSPELIRSLKKSKVSA